MEEIIKKKILDIQDWPKPGVVFRDITPLLQDRELFQKTIDRIAYPYIGQKIDKVVGIDARGFLLASVLAYKLNAGLAIIRKKGKLPRETISKSYSLEYDSSQIEMHKDSIKEGERVLLVDDVLATGGTMKAALDLVEDLRGEVIGAEFLIELEYLRGREKLIGYKVNSLAKYKEEKAEAPIPLKSPLKIGIIGGTGFYDFFSSNPKEIEVETEYGYPSCKIAVSQIAGKEVYFLPRHGKSHTLPPHMIPYKANIKALKDLGVDIILAPCAAGSLKAEMKPGDFVIPDQFVNKTSKRDDTFFDGPEVSHIESANPYCSFLRDLAIEQAQKLNFNIHPKGTVVVIEGPRFSTIAESLWFSKMGWDLVNMTQYPENILASELGMCYLNISLVTDYDTGVYASQLAEPVSIGQVISNFKNNNEKLKLLISAIIQNISEQRLCDCQKKAQRAKM